MSFRALVPLAELGAAALMLLATLALVLATASAVGGQATPRAPAAPAAPAAPRPPASPDAAVTEGLSLALLQINARDRSADAIVLGLGQSLLALTDGGRPATRRPDVRRLAAVLVDALRGRELPSDARERMAAALAAALGQSRSADGRALAEAAQQLDRAFAQVSEALRAAGLGTPAIALVETELRRVASPR